VALLMTHKLSFVRPDSMHVWSSLNDKWKGCVSVPNSFIITLSFFFLHRAFQLAQDIHHLAYPVPRIRSRLCSRCGYCLYPTASRSTHWVYALQSPCQGGQCQLSIWLSFADHNPQQVSVLWSDRQPVRGNHPWSFTLQQRLVDI
jgi:hypothetical protein